MTTKQINDGGPVAYIPLLRGEYAIVSEADYRRVSEYQWRVGSNGYIYVCNRTLCPYTTLHRFIMEPDDSEQVHHINGKRSDCRRENLEKVNASEHQTKYHSHVVAERNVASRVYPLHRTCPECGSVFLVDPSHRGRNRYCTRTCGNRAHVRRRWSSRNSMLATREGGAA